MKAYSVYCYGYCNEGDQNPGWNNQVKITEGITTVGKRENGLCFLEGKGSILVDNRLPCAKISFAEVSKKTTKAFYTRHIAWQESKKVLHIPKEAAKESKDTLIHIIFDGELYIPFDNALRLLRISEDQIISCDSSVFGNGERYVFSMVFILKNNHSTEVLFGKTAIYNKDGNIN